MAIKHRHSTVTQKFDITILKKINYKMLTGPVCSIRSSNIHKPHCLSAHGLPTCYKHKIKYHYSTILEKCGTGFFLQKR